MNIAKQMVNDLCSRVGLNGGFTGGVTASALYVVQLGCHTVTRPIVHKYYHARNIPHEFCDGDNPHSSFVRYRRLDINRK